MTFLETCPKCRSDVKCYEQGDGTAHGRCRDCGTWVYIDDRKKTEEVTEGYYASLYERQIDYIKGEVWTDVIDTFEGTLEECRQWKSKQKVTDYRYVNIIKWKKGERAEVVE